MGLNGGLLDGKYILVTGGAAGIGLAICQTAAREGAFVLIADLNTEAGAAACALIAGEGGQAEFVECDVSDKASVEAAVAHFPKLDGVVNNAGIGGLYCDITEVEEDQFDRLMEVNVKGTFLMMQAAIARMRKTGSGSIVNIASVGGVVGTPNLTPYTMSKHAVIGLTRGAAVEQSCFGIRINAVCPGPTQTDMIENFAAKQGLTIADLGADLPLGRIAKPTEVAEAVVWLCSDKSSATTGSLMMVDCGYTAQ